MAISDLPKESRAAGKTLQDYLEGHLSYAKLIGTEKLAQLTAWLFSRLIFVVIAALTLLFLSTGLAYGLGQWLGATYVGFLIVGGGFALLFLILLLLHHALLRQPIMDSVVRLMFHDEPLEDFLHPTSSSPTHSQDEIDTPSKPENSQHA